MVDVLKYCKYNKETEKYQHVKLTKGQSGYDDRSSMSCPLCYSEAGDYGVVYNFTWQENPAGWNMRGYCGTCSFFEDQFVPYEEEE